MRAVRQRSGHLGRARAGEIRLDEYDVRATQRAKQRLVRERPHRGQIRDRRIEICRRHERLGERRPDGDHERRCVRSFPQDDETVLLHGRVIRLLREPDVDAIVSGESACEEPLHLVRMSWHFDRPAGKRGEHGDVLRSLVRPPGARRVVGGPVADEDRAHVLVTEIELDLLVGPLDDERCVRVHHGSVALEREPGRDSDHQLLADTHVEHTGMSRHLCDADLREHHRHALVRLERVGGQRIEAIAHRHRRTSATTAWGRSPCDAVSARSSSSWSRPSTRATLQPSSSKRAPIPPGQR